MDQLEWWPLPLPTRAWIRDNWARTQGAWRKLYKECNELVEGRPAILKPSKIFRSCSVIGFCRINTNSGSILRSYLGFMVTIDSESKETRLVEKTMIHQILVKMTIYRMISSRMNQALWLLNEFLMISRLFPLKPPFLLTTVSSNSTLTHSIRIGRHRDFFKRHLFNLYRTYTMDPFIRK